MDTSIRLAIDNENQKASKAAGLTGSPKSDPEFNLIARERRGGYAIPLANIKRRFYSFLSMWRGRLRIKPRRP